MPPPNTSRWSYLESAELYQIGGWGAPYFSVNEKGHIAVTPDPERLSQDGPGPGLHNTCDTARIDLFELVQDLRSKGVDLPLLLRFPDILRHRIALVNTCFRKAIAEYAYAGAYRGVYPVKVNQQRHLVEDVVAFGKAWSFGLEAGSKPELLIAIALMKGQSDGLIVCNGYKDAQYVETALLAQQLGHKVVLVLERAEELDIVLDAAKRLQIKPALGVRAKLSARGVGRWAKSSGERAKFGLRPLEIVRVVERLSRRDMLGTLQLLHFHIGSQVSNIGAIKTAMREASHLYVELAKLGCAMGYLDVGGGLAVDYDGSKTDDATSKNYDTQEYAYDVIESVQNACKRAGVNEPTIVSESGRAVAAYQSVLVFDVVGADELNLAPPDRITNPPPSEVLIGGEHKHLSRADEDGSSASSPQVIDTLAATLEHVAYHTLQECWHDASEARNEAQSLFNLGYLSLRDLARAEALFWHCCRKIAAHVEKLESVPDELRQIPELLGSIYFCNFSVFQSAPDIWAIDQLFPIAPIHRLDERPTVRATLADLTCDSDGMVDHFIDRKGSKRVLEAHEVTAGQDYILGMFLGGAYQEILGDLHNLFGDTNAVHVVLDEGGYSVAQFIQGDNVDDVLRYVQYEPKELLEAMRRQAETALREGRLSREQMRDLLQHYTEALRSYTYLRAHTTKEL